jgi:hypothetical protein
MFNFQIYWNLYIQDLLNNCPSKIQGPEHVLKNSLGGCEPSTCCYIIYGHDTEKQTVYNLTSYMIDQVLSHGYKPVTVGECLSDPPANWYRNATTGDPVT